MCILCGSTAQSIADVGASSAPSFARGHAKNMMSKGRSWLRTAGMNARSGPILIEPSWVLQCTENE